MIPEGRRGDTAGEGRSPVRRWMIPQGGRGGAMPRKGQLMIRPGKDTHLGGGSSEADKGLVRFVDQQLLRLING